MDVANRTTRIQPSATLQVTILVDTLKRAGKDIIDLGAGEPDFDTPAIIKEEGIRAIHEGFTKYTPVSGVLELRQAICDKYKRESDLNFSPSNILVTTGAKYAIMNALLAYCQAGDEVIIPSPFWTSYVEQVRFAEAESVVVETNESTGFKMTPEQLEAAVNPRTKILILNTPSNPTGSVYSENEINGLLEVIKPHDFYIIYDEIYEKIIYDGNRHICLAARPEIRDRVILVNGVSKAFAMTGWRIGYLAAQSDIVKVTTKIQSHSTSNPSSISQKASIAALKAGSTIYRDMVKAFDQRRKYLVDQLTGMPRIRCTLPDGAFYVFPNVSGYFGLRFNDKVINNSIDFCSVVLEEEGLALVPGEAFGSADHVRISYATSLNNLRKACERLNRVLKKLRDGN